MRSLLCSAALVAAIAPFASGCGDESLSCDLLADPDNCWARAALHMSQCLPEGGQGVLSAERDVCTFDDGSEVVFDAPLPEDAMLLEELAFRVERDGGTCARFIDTFANRMEVTGLEGRVVAELSPGGEFRLHCPGGPSYSRSFDSLFECAAEGGPLPTDGFEVEPDSVTFWISSASTPAPIFTCVR